MIFDLTDVDMHAEEKYNAEFNDYKQHNRLWYYKTEGNLITLKYDEVEAANMEIESEQ